MHEASLIQSLMRHVNEVAARQGATRVAEVAVWLGALSHFSAAHFREHFDRAAQGGLAEGARLEIIVSDDIADSQAQDVVLRSVEVEV
jgi:hydrogenase nickel incorporation protein HypA/HybF